MMRSGNSLEFSNQINETRFNLQGEVFWTLLDHNGEVIGSGKKKNVVTLDAGILLASFMRGTSVVNTSAPKWGIRALAVGVGKAGWDPMSPPPAEPTQHSLYGEIARKVVASAKFIDPSGNDSTIPTNVVDFSFTFGASEAVGPLVEMGLIGGDLDGNNMYVRNPITPPNSDTPVDIQGKDVLCNYLTFPVINKAPGNVLNWTWRLTF
jgi:hypothetical protein